MSQYYYLDGTAPIGPLSLQDMYTLIDREVVEPTTMVCREGGADWQLLLAVPELNGKSKAALSTRGSSSSSTESRRSKKGGVNVTAIIIAFLFSVVAIYVTYTVSHAGQESAQSAAEMDRLLGR